jgi:hypothetical protein
METKNGQQLAEELGVKFGPNGADIPLSRPIKVGGAEVKALRMREPELDDQLAQEDTPGSDLQKERAMVANLCMVTPAELGKLKLRDYRKVQAALVGFLA